MRALLRFKEHPFVNAKSPFDLGISDRRLRLVLDSEHILDQEALEMLNGFSRHEALWVVSTDQSHIHPIQMESEEDDRVLGSVRVGDIIHGAGFTHVEQWKHFGRSPILKDNFEMPAGPWQDSAYCYRQYSLAQIADSLNADVLVTDDAFLLEFQRPGFLRTDVLRSIEAVELMGSYLRNHGDFTVHMSPRFTNRLNRTLFYIVWSRDLLPQSWKWFHACAESDRVMNNDLVSLGGSALTRVQQALKSRDFVHWQSVRSTGNVGADDILYYLDMLLVSLVAAFDVAARVADIALGLSTDRNKISWRRREWRRAIAQDARDLSEVMEPNSTNGQTYKLLSLLRNSVHGEALDSLRHQKSDRYAEDLLIVPKGDRSAIEQLLDQLGGRRLWGYADLGGQFGCIQPERLVELLLPRAIGALDDIMDRTPVERLPGINPGQEFMSSSSDIDFWHPSVRRAVRLLGGI